MDKSRSATKLIPRLQGLHSDIFMFKFTVCNTTNTLTMKNIRCIIIDDDPDDRELFEIALENSGHPFNLLPLSSGSKALEIFTDIEAGDIPDYIFLDLNMPLLSGKECLQEIRKVSVLHITPVIIYSTSSYHLDIAETKEYGATHFLTKTPDIDRLSVILGKLFSKTALPYELS